MDSIVNMGWIDYLIMLIYFLFVLGIGWALKKYMRNATDFLEAGRSLPAWVTGLAFISANLGALEVIGMAASGAKYGMATVHFYWIGAIPAMVFLAIFMMPFYYGSKARSVPEYLKLRFDEKTRGFNAFSFAIMTVLASGISMYALALLAQVLLPFDFQLGPFTEFDFYLLISALIVLVYTFLGGLTSAIYNEVLQFFLIVVGFTPLVILALVKIGGWEGLREQLAVISTGRGYESDAFISSWQYAGSPEANPLGVEWFGIIMGLGFVLSFGYWCTNFLVVQRAMAAGSMSAARKTPLIGAIPKMFIPVLVILPGMIAIALTSGSIDAIPIKEVIHDGLAIASDQFQSVSNGLVTLKDGTIVELVSGNFTYDYDKVIPTLLGDFFPTGVLGLGVTALLASFMSGMAGNVSAFNTVFTYDIYQSYIRPNQSDRHYLLVGRLTTIFGVLVSILAAYVAKMFNNVMDFLQLIFAFINAPLFATFLLGMFWKRATGHGAFYGLISGTFAAAVHHGLTIPAGATSMIKGGWITGLDHALKTYPSEMAQNFWTAIYAFTVCLVLTIIISFATRQLKTSEQLKGLVYSLTPKYREEGLLWYQKPEFFAAVVLAIALVLSIIFW